MAVIKLTIYVQNLTNVMGLFDKIQVWRSETGIDGTYFQITDTSDTAATLLATGSGPFTLNGTTLLLKIDEDEEETLTITLADPVTIENLVTFINEELTGITASEDAGALRLTSDSVGTVSVLEITGGTSLTEIGFTSGDKDYGEDEYITMQAGVTEYQYDDSSGDADNYYKTRYFNSATLAISSFGNPVKGDIGSIVSPSILVKASGIISELDGSPIVDRLVSFYNVGTPPTVTSGGIGVVGRSIDVATDQSGYFETMLVTGTTVDVLIAGTGVIRRIEVPDADFDVLTVIAAADDNFQIQVPDIPTAIRRS